MKNYLLFVEFIGFILYFDALQYVFLERFDVHEVMEFIYFESKVVKIIDFLLKRYIESIKLLDVEVLQILFWLRLFNKEASDLMLII